MSLLNDRDANLAALRVAVAEARVIAREQSHPYTDWNGLSVDRQVFRGGDFAWHVRFGLRYFMTQFFVPDRRGRSDDEIAEEIWSFWDAEWDDVRVDDFHVGSSAFKQGESKY